MVLDKTDYHQIAAVDKLADVVAKYLKKGDRVYLEGQLTTLMWGGERGAGPQLLYRTVREFESRYFGLE